MNRLLVGHRGRMLTALIGITFASTSVLVMAWDWVRHPDV